MAYNEILGCFYHKNGKQHIRNVVFDDSVAIKGAGAPTSSTVADFEGQVYTDTTNKVSYICVGINKATGQYTWQAVEGEGGGGGGGNAGLEFKHVNTLSLAQLAVFLNANIDNPLIKYLKIKFTNTVEVSIPQYTIAYSNGAISSVSAGTALSEVADGYFSLGEVDRTAEVAKFSCDENFNGVVSINYSSSPAISYKFYGTTSMSTSAADTYTQTVSGIATTVTSTDATVFNVSYLNDGSITDPV